MGTSVFGYFFAGRVVAFEKVTRPGGRNRNHQQTTIISQYNSSNPKALGFAPLNPTYAALPYTLSRRRRMARAPMNSTATQIAAAKNHRFDT